MDYHWIMKNIRALHMVVTASCADKNGVVELVWYIEAISDMASLHKLIPHAWIFYISTSLSDYIMHI